MDVPGLQKSGDVRQFETSANFCEIGRSSVLAKLIVSYKLIDLSGLKKENVRRTDDSDGLCSGISVESTSVKRQIDQKLTRQEFR